MKIFSFFIFFTFLFSASFAQKTGKVSGILYDAETESYISNVKVNLNNQQKISDANGMFEFTTIPFGTYTITFESNEFEKYSKKITIDNEYVSAGITELYKIGTKKNIDTTKKQINPIIADDKNLKKNILKKDEDNNTVVDDIIEQIATSSDNENIDAGSLTEDIEYYKQNPLNLNDAKEEDLSKFIFLTEFEIKSILFYLKKSGPMYTAYELQLVYGLPPDKIQMLLPFITVAPKASIGQFPIKKALTSGRHQIITRIERILENQTGYSSISDDDYKASPGSRYIGGPLKLYTKYKYSYRNKLYWGLTMENDPGENFFNRFKHYEVLQDTTLNKKMKEPKGFDFYSAHLQINDVKLYKDIISLKTICLGDFEVKFGQGLVMSSGLAVGKSSAVLNINRLGYGLKKYSSTNENQFMRGAATTLRIKNLDIIGFYSYKYIDANATAIDNSDGEALEVSSLQITGMHTIPGEVKDRHIMSEAVYGGNATYNQDKYKIGLTYIRYKFGAPLTISNIQPYNQFDFSGQENSNLSFNYQFAFKDIHFFGEEAMSQNGGYAYLNGMTIKMAPQVAFSLLHRNYEKDYQSYYGKAFSESMTTANERGLYAGTEIFPYKKIKLSGYYDVYWFPWIKSSAKAPTNGVDYYIQADFYVSRNVTMLARYRQEIKPANASGQVGDVTLMEDVDNRKFRYQISYSLLPNLKLKNRIDLVEYKKGTNATSHGYMIYQDVLYSFQKLPLSLTLRYGIFDTDTYDARIYSYETDVLYGYSIPALYDKGTRAYFMAKYTVAKGLDFWFRIAQTHYANKTSIGSGLTAIDGKDKTDITFQLRYKF